jgi:hypothetical protein
LFTRVNLVNQGAPTNNSVTLLQDGPSNLTSTVPYVALLNGVNTNVVNGLNVTNASGTIGIQAGNYLVDASAYFANGAGDMTICTIEVKKNNITIYPTNLSTDNLSGATSQIVNALPGFVSMNGTDTLTVTLVSTFSGGTTSVSTALRLVSI